MTHFCTISQGKRCPICMPTHEAQVSISLIDSIKQRIYSKRMTHMTDGAGTLWIDSKELFEFIRAHLTDPATVEAVAYILKHTPTDCLRKDWSYKEMAKAALSVLGNGSK